MIANPFTVAETEPSRLRGALAQLLAVTREAVDVADTDGDQEARRWDSPVFCTYRVLPPGDLALELDIYVEDETAGALSEADLAQGLAVRTATSVLYPSMDIDLDSAYWVAVPDGRVVRCRLEAIDSDEDTRHRVDAVEEKVADLPRAKVEWLPEALSCRLQGVLVPRRPLPPVQTPHQSGHPENRVGHPTTVPPQPLFIAPTKSARSDR
ncbi:hypothetical protein [Streptomyces sp. LARHCF252]